MFDKLRDLERENKIKRNGEWDMHVLADKLVERIKINKRKWVAEFWCKRGNYFWIC